MNACTPTVPRSITLARASTNGGIRASRLLLILTIRNASSLTRIVLSQVVPLTSWSSEYANVMEVIVGSWLGLTRCGINRDRSRVGILAAIDIEDRKQAEDRLRRENVALREEIDKTSMFEEIVGTSSALKSVLLRISKVAPSDSTVLITGETGTGKELVARAIHRRSDRASRAFISVNCSAIPRDLIASELFGHEKGAFTGATQQRLGRFELANGGTLFLDEVGELPAETQIALLRVLQEHEFERVGGNAPNSRRRPGHCRHQS